MIYIAETSEVLVCPNDKGEGWLIKTHSNIYWLPTKKQAIRHGREQARYITDHPSHLTVRNRDGSIQFEAIYR